MPNLQLAGLINRAISAHQSGNLSEAEFLYKAALAQDAKQFDVLHMLGVLRGQQGNFEDADRFISRALKVAPVAEAYENHARVLLELKRYEDALRAAEKALSLKSNNIAALNFRGCAFLQLKKPEIALENFDKALAVKPDFVMAIYNRGEALSELKRFDESLAAYDKAIGLAPAYAQAWAGRGKTLHALKRLDDALQAHDRALAISPNLTEALIGRGNVLTELKRVGEALDCYEKAIAVQPYNVEAFYNRGVALRQLQRYDLAVASYEQALTLNPEHKHAFSGLADSVLRLCDWARRDMVCDELRRRVTEQRTVIAPFVLLSYLDDDLLQLACAKTYVADRVLEPAQPMWKGDVWHNEKIRIAYLSADFHSHATAYLTAELFERHDRSRFELTAMSFGPDDRSTMRTRLAAAFDHFVDVRTQSDEQIARLLSSGRIDIAIDLKGHTQDSRPGILACRPAPIQVSYLGFPATMGANFIDYIIADPVILPFDRQPFYTENIVHLPDCYQANDRQRAIAAQTPMRADAGLPAQGFVFCSFNNTWKATPAIFDIWMRLLLAVEGSVLWLVRDSAPVESNLRNEAAARGVDPARLVFADMLPLAEHLARHRLADLFLDTLPYNAHTTASDALWAGLPVLTCRGETFAGRVAASLLNAVGLPELVTANHEDYEALALKLAREPGMLAEIRAKLARNREAFALFDTLRFARHIEAAYTTMWEIWQRGEQPHSFSVDIVSSRVSH